MNFEMLNTLDEMSVKTFLQKEALDMHEQKTVATRLVFSESNNELVGFFSLHNDLVEVAPSIIQENGWNLSTSDQSYYPGIKLHYLGVDSRYRNLGIGKLLMAEVRAIAVEASLTSGCNFITVESYPSATYFYGKQGFKIKSWSNGLYHMLFSLESLFNPDLKATPLIGKQRIQEVHEEVKIAIREFRSAHAEVASTSGIEELLIDEVEFSSDVDLNTLEVVCKAFGVQFP